MNANLREQLITLAVALTLGAGFLFGLVLPRSSTLGAIRLEGVKLQQDNHTLAEDNKSLAVVQQEVDELRQEIEVARLRIPVDDGFAEYERNLGNLGREHGLWDEKTEPQILDTTKQGPATDQNLGLRRMSIDFNADFEKLYNFLRAMESQDRVTRIENISIKPADRTPGGLAVRLEFSIFHGSL